MRMIITKVKPKPTVKIKKERTYETESPQVGDLFKIRDIVVFGVKKRISQRIELVEEASQKGILLKENGTLYDKEASIYRFLDTLRFLNFDETARRDQSGMIKWSDSAIELAEYGSVNYLTNVLSESEKAIFRKQIFASQAKVHFFAWFCSDDGSSIPDNQQQFIRTAHPIYLKQIEIEPKKKYVEIRSNPKSVQPLVRKPRRDFMTTYRLWCLDTDIVDELNIKEAERCGIPKPYSHVLYPLDPAVHIEPSEFLAILRKAIKGKSRQSIRVPIPWLMYRICPHYKISVEVFKSLLLKTCEIYYHALRLERTAGVLIQFEGKNFFKQDHTNRYGNHRYYVVVKGAIRSNLVIIPTP